MPIWLKQPVGVLLTFFFRKCHVDALVPKVHAYLIVEIVLSQFQFVLQGILGCEEFQVQLLSHSVECQQLFGHIVVCECAVELIYILGFCSVRHIELT